MLLEEPDSLEPIIGDAHEHSESVRVRDVVKNNLENLPFLLINTNLIMICIIKGNCIGMYFYSPFTGCKYGMYRNTRMHFYSPFTECKQGIEVQGCTSIPSLQDVNRGCPEVQGCTSIPPYNVCYNIQSLVASRLP
jgi:hypothetical protein